jgi:hypothetical protein
MEVAIIKSRKKMFNLSKIKMNQKELQLLRPGRRRLNSAGKRKRKLPAPPLWLPIPSRSSTV